MCLLYFDHNNHVTSLRYDDKIYSYNPNLEEGEYAINSLFSNGAFYYGNTAIGIDILLLDDDPDPNPEFISFCDTLNDKALVKLNGPLFRSITEFISSYLPKLFKFVETNTEARNKLANALISASLASRLTGLYHLCAYAPIHLSALIIIVNKYEILRDNFAKALFKKASNGINPLQIIKIWIPDCLPTVNDFLQNHDISKQASFFTSSHSSSMTMFHARDEAIVSIDAPESENQRLLRCD